MKKKLLLTIAMLLMATTFVYAVEIIVTFNFSPENAAKIEELIPEGTSFKGYLISLIRQDYLNKNYTAWQRGREVERQAAWAEEMLNMVTEMQGEIGEQ